MTWLTRTSYKRFFFFNVCIFPWIHICNFCPSGCLLSIMAFWLTRKNLKLKLIDYLISNISTTIDPVRKMSNPRSLMMPQSRRADCLVLFCMRSNICITGFQAIIMWCYIDNSSSVNASLCKKTLTIQMYTFFLIAFFKYYNYLYDNSNKSDHNALS